MEEATKKEYDANRYKTNKEVVQQQQAEYYKNNIGSKLYYCEICDDNAFGSNHDLKNHLGTYKHFMKWVWYFD